MTIVAIAGGTGKLGRTIVEALVQSGQHTVYILSSRPVDSPLSSAKVITVDYDNIESLAATIEDHGIHTIISTIALQGNAQAKSQLNLIKAADKSTITNRFAPSEWSIPYKQEQVERLPSMRYRLEAVQELNNTSLEFTLFWPGWFMDYYGIPHIKTHMDPFPFAVDVGNRAAAIPGSGDIPIAFTYTRDVAKVVAASLDLEKWPRHAYIIGDKLTWNRLLQTAEEVQGTKFTVTYDTIEGIEQGHLTELPSYKEVYQFWPKESFQAVVASYAIFSERGDFNHPDAEAINAQFPGLKMTSLKDLLSAAWKPQS